MAYIKLETNTKLLPSDVINNVDFITLAILFNPGQTAAHYRRETLAFRGRELTHGNRGWYTEYFRPKNHQWDSNGYVGHLWVNASPPSKWATSWFLTDRGFNRALLVLGKLYRRGLNIFDFPAGCLDHMKDLPQEVCGDQ